jgi:hypothetical protein
MQQLHTAGVCSCCECPVTTAGMICRHFGSIWKKPQMRNECFRSFCRLWSTARCRSETITLSLLLNFRKQKCVATQRLLEPSSEGSRCLSTSLLGYQAREIHCNHSPEFVWNNCIIHNIVVVNPSQTAATVVKHFTETQTTSRGSGTTVSHCQKGSAYSLCTLTLT